MTKDGFQEIWELLQQSNLNLFGKDIDKSFDVYYDSLKFITTKDLKLVVKKYRENEAKFPTIKQLLDIYRYREWKEKTEIKRDKNGYRIVECDKCDDIGLIPLRKLIGDATYIARCVCQKCKNPKIPYAGELINSGEYLKICDCCKKNLERFGNKKYCQECADKYYKNHA